MTTKPKPTPRVRASILIPTGIDHRLEAMAVTLGRSKSSLVAEGIERVHASLNDRQKESTDRVMSIVDARSEPPPPPPPASTKKAG